MSAPRKRKSQATGETSFKAPLNAPQAKRATAPNPVSILTDKLAELATYIQSDDKSSIVNAINAPIPYSINLLREFLQGKKIICAGVSMVIQPSHVCDLVMLALNHNDSQLCLWFLNAHPDLTANATFIKKISDNRSGVLNFFEYCMQIKRFDLMKFLWSNNVALREIYLNPRDSGEQQYYLLKYLICHASELPKCYILQELMFSRRLKQTICELTHADFLHLEMIIRENMGSLPHSTLKKLSELVNARKALFPNIYATQPQAPFQSATQNTLFGITALLPKILHMSEQALCDFLMKLKSENKAHGVVVGYISENRLQNLIKIINGAPPVCFIHLMQLVTRNQAHIPEHTKAILISQLDNQQGLHLFVNTSPLFDTDFARRVLEQMRTRQQPAPSTPAQMQ